jgi:hypothetical protein
MQIEKRYQIEQAAGTDENKPGLQYIQIDETSAVAANGVIAAVVPCASGKGEVKGPITRDSLMYARNHTLGKGAVSLHLEDEKTVIAEDTTTFPRSLSSHTKKVEDEQLELIRVESGKDGEKEAPSVRAIKDLIPSVVGGISLRLNPEMLFKLAKALGDKEEVIMFMNYDVEDFIVKEAIRVHGSEGAVGVIMPMNQTGEES